MDAYLQLAVAEGFDEGTVDALLDPTADPCRLLTDPPGPPEVPPRVLRRLHDPDLGSAAARMRRDAERLGLALLTPDRPEYPAGLQLLPNRPLTLFCRGDLEALAHQPAVAFVGSRTPTGYGREGATQFAGALVRAGVVLWSGLARGIDAIAHRAAVEGDRPTVAVLAGGLDHVYPREHERLIEAIVGTGGCVVSELPPGRRARRGHFVRRNRILAAGAAATLVIEASLTSGALHTAAAAADCGRDVFALPGPFHSERSQGCHRLIADGAGIVEGPEALLRDLGVAGQGRALALTASADEQAVLDVLRRGARPSDLLHRESGLDRATFLRVTLALEGRGVIRRQPGDVWIAT